MNKAIKTIWIYEWTSFTRNKFQLLIVGITFLLGLYAINYGQSVIKVQRETIRDVRYIQQKEFHQYQVSFEQELVSVADKRKHEIAANPAYAWHRHGYHAILPPQDYAALAIGQRDLFPCYYRLTGMSLHYQLFENELANPVKLYVGNFDLSFVIIYLFPLLIIAFTYGLYSSEKENGTLPLLSLQSVSVRKILLMRLGFYFVLITGLAVIISLVGLATSGNMLSSPNLWQAVTWLSAIIFYCSFWFALLFLIISLRKSSSFNAMTAAGCWLFLLIVIPAILNITVTTKYPINSASLAGLTRRTSLENEGDEQEATEVIMAFLPYHPELAGSDSLIRNNLLAKAYAALTSLKDIKSKKEVDQYNRQVINRDHWVSDSYWINPAVNVQDVLTRIVHTDLRTFLNFHEAMEVFHKRITGFYFQKLFWDQPITKDDYAQLPVFEIHDIPERSRLIWNNLLKLVSSVGLLFTIGFVNIGRKSKRL